MNLKRGLRREGHSVSGGPRPRHELRRGDKVSEPLAKAVSEADLDRGEPDPRPAVDEPVGIIDVWTIRLLGVAPDQSKQPCGHITLVGREPDPIGAEVVQNRWFGLRLDQQQPERSVASQ